MKRSSNFLSLVLCAVWASSLALSSAYAKSSKKVTPDSGLKGLQMKSGDEAGNDLKALRAEALIAAQEDRAIQQAQKLLKKYKGTSLEPDIMMRLGELHLRRAKTDRFLELQRSSDDMVKIAPKLILNAGSKKQIQRGIEYFDQIEDRFPKFDKIDVVVFNNAFANQQIGVMSKAEKKFIKLINLYPYSHLMPDAHLALGEMKFSSKDFSQALKHFQAIRNYPDSQVYPYGMYKAGWTYYNQRDNDAALKELEDVVKYGRHVAENNIDARLDLRKEALIDMALFFEDVRPAKDAYAYFERQAGELDVSPVLLRLTELYKRHSRHADVKVLLTEYIKRNATSSFVPKAYVELMDASEKLRKRLDVVILLGNMRGICRANSDWAKAQSTASLRQKDHPLFSLIDDESNTASKSPDKEPTVSTVCMQVFDKMALGYANKWLKGWQKDESQRELADVAERAFALYLETPVVTEDTARARFVYSELLFKGKKYREASQNYHLTGTMTKDKKMQHDANYYAIMSLEKAVGDKWNDKDEELLKKLGGVYIKTHPAGDFVMDIQFKMAFVAYEKGKLDEAASVFFELGQKHAKLEKGLKAQDLYLDILNLKKDYKGLRDYAEQLRGTATGDRKGRLTKIYEESYFLIVQKLEESRKYAEAIREYQNFAARNPESTLKQKAMWNSMQLHFKVMDYMNGAQAALDYGRQYAQTKEGVDALMKSAQTFEAMGQLSKAAEVVKSLAQIDKENSNKWILLAAEFYLLMSDFGSARPIFESLRTSKDTKTAFRALVQLEKIADKEHKETVRINYLQQIAASGNQPEASEASVFFVENLFHRSKWDEAFQQAKKIVGAEKAGASKSAMARARFIQAKILQKEFYDQSVKSKLERVQTVLALKTEKLSKAQVAFQSAVNYGDPVISVRALSELANCYLHFSESLNGMPLPAGLPETELQAFKAQMNELAIPMEEKGIETKMLALKTATQFSVQDPIVTQLQDEMKKLNQQVAKDTGRAPFEVAPVVLPVIKGMGS